jgi:hypothetical protein
MAVLERLVREKRREDVVVLGLSKAPASTVDDTTGQIV